MDATVSVADSDLQHKSPIQLWEIIVGFVAIPGLIQLVKTRNLDSEQVRALAIGAAFVSTGVAMYLKGDFSHVDDWALTFGKLVIASQTAYEMIWKSKIVAPVTAALGAAGGGPSTAEQRAGFKGTTSPP